MTDRDEPVATALSIPEAVRKLEREAMRMYRAKYQDGVLWQELDHSTRSVWVDYAETSRAAAEIGRSLPGQDTGGES